MNKMNVQIIDTHKLLTKSQKMKIKDNFKNNIEITQILRLIHYNEDIKRKYEILNVIKEDDNNIKLEFLFNEKKVALKNKLKNKLGYLKNKKRPDWVMYDKLKSQFKDMIPSPDTVLKDKEVYKPILEKFNDKNPIYKYIQLCFNYE